MQESPHRHRAFGVALLAARAMTMFGLVLVDITCTQLVQGYVANAPFLSRERNTKHIHLPSATKPPPVIRLFFSKIQDQLPSKKSESVCVLSCLVDNFGGAKGCH